jgi:hypothetical protein
MSSNLRKRIVVLSFLSLFFVCSQSISAQDKTWREITPAELQMKTSTVEPNADAEAIFWEVRVDDASENLVMKHYVRVKVFSERGREKYSKVDIPFVKGAKIKNIMARVIKPDGSIVELAKEDVFEREIAKAGKLKIKAKSFAVPGIEPGVIVEYRYQEVYPLSSANNMRMVFQHDIPIQNISYYFKPAANVRYLTFNMNENKFVKDKNGFYRATLEKVPAIKDEPRMPPQDEVRSWLLLYYTDDTKGTASDFWSRAGGYIARTWEIKDTLKPGKELKAAAAEITSGATSPDEQLRKIYDFCKLRVKNISFDPNLTDEQKEKSSRTNQPATHTKNYKGQRPTLTNFSRHWRLPPVLKPGSRSAATAAKSFSTRIRRMFLLFISRVSRLK